MSASNNGDVVGSVRDERGAVELRSGADRRVSSDREQRDYAVLTDLPLRRRGARRENNPLASKPTNNEDVK